MDAVLPLTGRDIERFGVLARSLQRYFEGLGTFYVVVPDGARAAMAPAIARAGAGLPIEVVPEGRWVPEMASFRHLPGWYKQQLVKIAAAQVVTSDYYLTLDADVVCTRKCTVAQLLPGGKSGCFIMNQDDHPQWYDGAEATLRVKAPRRGVLHNVTPVVWAKAGVLELIAHLNGVAERREWASGKRGLLQRLFFRLHLVSKHRREPPWRAWLAASRPWAEYAMYFTLLEATGRFERYHFLADTCIYDIERSVWWKSDDFSAWDPKPLFAGEGPPFFVVVQSNTGLDVGRVWKKLEPWLGERAAQAAP